MRSINLQEMTGKPSTTVTKWSGNSQIPSSLREIRISMPHASMVTMQPFTKISWTTQVAVSAAASSMSVVSRVSLKSGPSGSAQRRRMIGQMLSASPYQMMILKTGETKRTARPIPLTGKFIDGCPKNKEVHCTTSTNIDLPLVITCRPSPTNTLLTISSSVATKSLLLFQAPSLESLKLLLRSQQVS